MELDRQRIEALVAAVADRLEGDWLLVGGALVALWLLPRRVTEDVDIIGLGESGAQRSKLLGLAFDLGLPVETLNSAADFFVERIEGWRQQIEPLHRGAQGTVFRPTPDLFLLLKLPPPVGAGPRRLPGGRRADAPRAERRWTACASQRPSMRFRRPTTTSWPNGAGDCAQRSDSGPSRRLAVRLQGAA